MKRALHQIILFLSLSALVFTSCGNSEENKKTTKPAEASIKPATEKREIENPPTARMDMHNHLKLDLKTSRHESDGKGSVVMTGGPKEIPISTPGQWEFEYAAGPRGIKKGGGIYFQVPAFWEWSTPQVLYPHAPGYTRVTTNAQGLVLKPETIDMYLLYIEIQDRDMKPGEKVSIVYGAGPMGALSDCFAERKSVFWFAVDGNADRVRRLLDSCPSVDVLPGPASRLVLFLASTARPGEDVKLTAAVLDDVADAAYGFNGTVRLSLSGGNADALPVPESMRISASDKGRVSVSFKAAAPGEYRIKGTTRINGSEYTAVSNPLIVSTDFPRILWADFHGHSNSSDGTGTVEDYYAYARDVAALDIAALTDHDHYGMEALDQHPGMWEEMKNTAARFNDPGHFVALSGYEWTSWIHGHRHVLFFNNDGEIYSSLDEKSDTPRELWKLLTNYDAITIAHHTAGAPIPTNWSYAPDPSLEPVVEISSVHGSSEAYDSPFLIREYRKGHSARNALAMGYRLGFVGSGDSHDGHPGNAHLDFKYGFVSAENNKGIMGKNGLAAIMSTDLTRRGVRDAIKNRRVYATSGPRILLEVDLDKKPMGSVVKVQKLPEKPVLRIWAAGTAPIRRVDLVRSGLIRKNIMPSLKNKPQLSISFTQTVTALKSGEYVYVRIMQTDNGLAWSSPVFIE